MESEYLKQTNIIATYAGYYRDEIALKASSSGGVVSAISEIILRKGGIVYGATYSEDFYSAHYLRVEECSALTKLKGSKYVYVKKQVYLDGEWKSVYEAVCEDVAIGRTVLFIGLSCDVAAVKRICQNKNIENDGLYTIELLCDGVTNENVHEEYIRKIEDIHKSKVVDFTVRNKRDGWTPLYICAKLQDGSEHIIPFYNSAYGYAFNFYKKKACYRCVLKGKNRYADMTVGDFWGCEPEMKEYNEDGVSIIYVQTDRGKHLLEKVIDVNFMLMETDAEYALRHSPRYFNSHPENKKWNEFDRDIRKIGLWDAVRKQSKVYMPACMRCMEDKQVVLWGAGYCFHKLAPYVMERIKVKYVVDSNPEKWDKITEYGIMCKAPETVVENDVFVLIMVENTAVVCQIINKLIDMGKTSFDYIDNWIINTL
ncbi:Coenzyme F420-reducing hydrogenase, beta subunit [Butyrivibrio hungatei]|uniref:Coenzyme F420-reducing hydrogenase, beta subunit n=1 Tax=Butyrivibrio hungatei TaxID=185008 RepID=A0A1G5C8F2_9FIRM|nr:Coenzyme F420 hydrogenase/dehydrogenase, beta subunit C-terminal domain [Butyrivibrio hungatei]SCX98564.1 Coenzyme F420-reducing hydrogenase, beta subunit [Butyrivibrio hungatei]